MNCLHILLSVASLHLAPGDYNQVNPGIFCQTDTLELGIYRNSDWNTSILLGRSTEWLMYGIVSGYNPKIVPYIGLHHTLGYLDIMAAPLIQNDGPVEITGIVLGFRLIVF